MNSRCTAGTIFPALTSGAEVFTGLSRVARLVLVTRGILVDFFVFGAFQPLMLKSLNLAGQRFLLALQGLHLPPQCLQLRLYANMQPGSDLAFASRLFNLRFSIFYRAPRGLLLLASQLLVQLHAFQLKIGLLFRKLPDLIELFRGQRAARLVQA